MNETDYMKFWHLGLFLYIDGFCTLFIKKFLFYITEACKCDLCYQNFYATSIIFIYYLNIGNNIIWNKTTFYHLISLIMLWNLLDAIKYLKVNYILPLVNFQTILFSLLRFIFLKILILYIFNIFMNIIGLKLRNLEKLSVKMFLALTFSELN